MGCSLRRDLADSICVELVRAGDARGVLCIRSLTGFLSVQTLPQSNLRLRTDTDTASDVLIPFRILRQC
jgi:hypothetical protein